ncbi:hypothetical protein OAR29_04565, partial [Rhodospirillales bacterium]|nr:hypothetical protein [Rhodospirillales bacterium]
INAIFEKISKFSRSRIVPILSKVIFSKKKSRVKWTRSCFVISDKRIPDFSYEFRQQRQGNLAYEQGIIERAEILSKSYFLDLIDFKDGDIFYACGANVGDMHL